MDMIKEKLSLVPNLPGCYQMKNKDGMIIYVGKAKKLKNRLSSYFRGKHTGKTAKLVSEIVDFDYVVVGSEKESLILELNLIKKYDPKYNILLRDDKSYPYIELTNEKVPKLSVVRNINFKKNQTNLYGPYPNVTAARNTVNLLNRIYPLRKCKNFGKKPCLYYHIGECLGYCAADVDELKIKEMKADIIKFLKGDTSLITKKLKEEMLLESNKMNYEKALELKELLDYINITVDHQKVEISDALDRDIFGYFFAKGYLSIQVFFLRNGKIVGKHSKIIPTIEEYAEELNRYIATFYESDVIKPKEILVPDICDINLLQEFLEIKVLIPQKGTKLEIVKMANNNAKENLTREFALIERDEERTIKANEELMNVLKLTKLDRIEIFDNSNLFGNFNVSGMVVFVDGRPYKNGYRKFKITFDKNDDYHTMKEVIYRRYFRVLKDNLDKPDLIIVDGGINQMNAAREIISSLNLDIMVVGLKKDSKHTTNALLAFDPIVEIPIDKTSNLFYLLERMQDEVHEFTINYHKKLRSKGMISSVLDNIEGIGSKRKHELLKKYNSINKMNEAAVEELAQIIPLNVAINLKKFISEYKEVNK
ncbi:MAG: excinuclease ABC subunit UvrC [Bacilli bacterium]|nr:excinuclease ABC subunit UvrC [Bacilli bacterium]